MSVCSVSVYPSSTTIKTGNWYYGAYAVVNASSNCCTDVEWYSDSPSVASVNQSTGYIYGVSPGTTKIYARSKVDSSKSDYITVTVTSGTICVDSVTLNRSSISLEKGDTFTLSATVCPTNATNKTISWRSSNTSVATVSSGVVTAKARGHAYIYAEAQDGSGEYDSCYVNVTEDILVSSVSLNYSSYTLNANGSVLLRETVCPTNATNKCVEWTSDKPHIAFVNPDSGLVMAQGTGTAKITATAQDGSSKYAECTITVNPPVAVTDVELCPTSLTMNVGDIEYLCASITPSNATNQTVTWCSSNENVATVGLYTGRISANMAGITTITATTADGGYSDSCEVWVHGKTPVFLIHGRISHSNATWGIKTNIPSGANNNFNSSIDVEYAKGKKYTQVDSQSIVGVVASDYDDADKPCNLGYELQNAGYKENVNLFAFNYPNKDAVVHSANKFKKYIENLISYVRTSGTNEMKACFYASKCDYIEQNHKINLVGHSMGGLVSRYYVENLGQDNHVDKLITICTPHWGSNLADYSTSLSIKHVLCDHDLDPDSEMYGGKNKDVLHNGCPLWDITDLWTNCTDVEYETTQELLYSGNRETKYYAIAGLDYIADYLPKKDNEFDMSTNFVTYQQISDFMFQNKVYKLSGKDSQIINKIDFKNEGDNVVPFLSQIGWTNNSGDSPHKRIQMEKILVIVDANGGNNLVSHLHGKIPHRNCVMENIMLFLSE